MGNKESEIRLQGIAASPGIAIGRVLVIGKEIIKAEKKSVSDKNVPIELKKFEPKLKKRL